MKLNETKPYLETSGDMEEQFFSIQDTGMIFDILRNKMYSNPILAIAREISCNARDAHREVGTPEVPIHIHIPNNLEKYYKIRDFGPGISPDRMANVFIKYTASTKRNDNIQTGGFGLGAKTPFSYSESFSITTNYNGMQYSYSCNIDETKVGKLLLLSETPTKEPNGTEIQIPVLPKDFQAFATWTEQACRHWDVKPIIKGGTIDWQVPEKILEGNGWAIVQDNNYNYYNRDCKIIIDGIEYPLDLESLKKYADASLIESAHGKFLMYFNIGELSLSANREQIHLDEKTQKIIRQRLVIIQKELRQTIKDKIDALPNLWEANIFYRKDMKKAFHNLNFLGAFSWKGIVLTDSYVQTTCPVYSFSKGKYSRKYGTNNDKLSRSTGQHFNFEENSELYINDLPIKEPTPRHVKLAFDNNKNLKTLYIVCPTDTCTLQVLNDKINLDKMAPKKLSSITKATARNYTPAASRLLIFKFDSKAGAFRQVSYSSLDEDTNSKVLCTLNKVGYPTPSRVAMIKNNQQMSSLSFKTILSKFPNHSFYGVDSDAPADRVEEEFSDFEDIQDFIQEKILDQNNIDYVQLRYAINHSYHNNRLTRYEADIVKELNNDKSIFTKLFFLRKKIKSIAEQDKGLLEVYEALNGEISPSDLSKFAKDNPSMDIEALEAKYDSQYQLLKHIQTYNLEDALSSIVSYINLVDKELGDK